jgi:hypothetical protein
MVILTIASTIGLLIKIWRSGLTPGLKWLSGLAVIFPLAFCVVEWKTMEYGYPFISSYLIIRYAASFIIALNWSINLSRMLFRWSSTIIPQLSIPFLAIGLTFLIPFLLLRLGILLEKQILP